MHVPSPPTHPHPSTHPPSSIHKSVDMSSLYSTPCLGFACTLCPAWAWLLLCPLGECVLIPPLLDTGKGDLSEKEEKNESVNEKELCSGSSDSSASSTLEREEREEEKEEPESEPGKKYRQPVSGTPLRRNTYCILRWTTTHRLKSVAQEVLEESAIPEIEFKLILEVLRVSFKRAWCSTKHTVLLCWTQIQSKSKYRYSSIVV